MARGTPRAYRAAPRQATYFALCLLFLLVTPPRAQGDEAGMPLADQRNLYATVTGGWYLQQNCDFLTAAQQEEFDWHLKQMTVDLGRRIGLDGLTSLQLTGRDFAQGPEFAGCSKRAREISMSSVLLARTFVQRHLKKTYAPGISEKERNLRLFSAIALRLKIARKCDWLPADIAQESRDVFAAVEARLRSTASPMAVDEALQRAEEASHHPRFLTCEQALSRYAVSGLQQLRHLEARILK